MCDLGYVIKDHVTALMQVMTDDLRSPYQQADPTKCLSTAFMTMYLMGGPAGARAASTRCDTHEVRRRWRTGAAGGGGRASGVRALLDAAMAATERTLFYVMLTDGEMPRVRGPGAGGKPGKFPGHVFVIERQARGSFNLYQSYIGQYDLGGLIERHTLSHGRGEMKALLQGLAEVLERREWDKRTTALWRRLTAVDAAHFEGCELGDRALVPCFHAVATHQCVAALSELVRRKLGELGALPRELDGQVYGSMEAYDTTNDSRLRVDGRVPLLTNAEVRSELAELAKKLG